MRRITFLCLLLLTVTSLAVMPRLRVRLPPQQPRIRIVLGDEGYRNVLVTDTNVDNNIYGLAGLEPHQFDDQSMTILADGPGERLLKFNVVLVNIGAGNLNFAAESVIPDPVYGDAIPVVHDFFKFSLLDTNRTELLAVYRDARLMNWDLFALVSFARENHSWFAPGLSAGRGVGSPDNYTAGNWIDIASVGNGEFILGIECDPHREHGLWVYDRKDVRIRIEAFQVTILDL